MDTADRDAGYAAELGPLLSDEAQRLCNFLCDAKTSPDMMGNAGVLLSQVDKRRIRRISPV